MEQEQVTFIDTRSLKVLEIQTRSHTGEIRIFPSLKEAMAETEKDTEIWKVSFSLPNGERVRLVRRFQNEPFRLEQMDELLEIIEKIEKGEPVKTMDDPAPCDNVKVECPRCHSTFYTAEHTDMVPCLICNKMFAIKRGQ
jgi:hypothetical protein